MNREQRIEKLMKLRGYSYDEALQIVLDDEAVDKGEPLPWDLTPEQIKNQKTMRKGDKVVKTGEKKKKVVKKNEEKIEIVKKFAEFLENDYENVKIINENRLISFVFGENTYELTLVEKRKPKK